MLPAIPSMVVLKFEDCKAVTATASISTLLSISDKTTQI